MYQQAKAVVVLDDARLSAEPLALVDAINATLLNKATMQRLSKNIQTFAKPDAAKDMAKNRTRGCKIMKFKRGSSASDNVPNRQRDHPAADGGKTDPRRKIFPSAMPSAETEP